MYQIKTICLYNSYLYLQVTQGWFYLLAEKLGRTSHMSVKNDPYTPTLPTRHRRDSDGSATGSTGSSGELSSIHGGDVEETCDIEAAKPTVQMVTVPLVSRRQKGETLILSLYTFISLYK